MADQFKQVVVLRDDLDLSSGKAAAQAAHASGFAADRADPEVRNEWLESSAVKVILAADDEQHLRQLRDEASDAGLPTSLVSDEGRTEIQTGTTTALAIGPATADAVDRITGNLQLY